MAKSILMIDDETMILKAFKVIFEDLGYKVTTTSDPIHGTAEAIARSFDLIVTDLCMPGRNGAEITAAIREVKPEARILVISGYPHDPIARQALEAGAIALVGKPFEFARILDFLKD